MRNSVKTTPSTIAAVLVGLLHAFIGSFIQIYARRYYVDDYTLITGLSLFALFLSGYISYRLLNEIGLILPISLLLFWVICGALIFTIEIKYYPMSQFMGVGARNDLVRKFWVLGHIIDVLNINLPAPPPGADYFISSLYLFILQSAGGSIESISRYVNDAELKF